MNRRSIIYGRVSSTTDRQNTDRQTYSLTSDAGTYTLFLVPEHISRANGVYSERKQVNSRACRAN